MAINITIGGVAGVAALKIRGIGRLGVWRGVTKYSSARQYGVAESVASNKAASGHLAQPAHGWLWHLLKMTRGSCRGGNGWRSHRAKKRIEKPAWRRPLKSWRRMAAVSGLSK